MMIEVAITSLIYLGVALMCLGAAAVLVVFAKISTSEGGSAGLFILAILFLCIVSAMLIWLGFATGAS